jgi:predicted phage terminase large subunit-like protein
MTASSPELSAILRRDLLSFARKAGNELHQGAPLVPNWHDEVMAHALTEVIEGRITRLMINVPPRYGKSLFCSVALPAYLLGRDPTRKIICTSYSQPLAEKHHSDCRRVMSAPWYQDLFGVDFIKKSATEMETSKGGFRFASSVGGSLTGRGGDLIIPDDLLNANDAHSDTARETSITWFKQTLLSRLDNKKTGAIIMVGQRLHHRDIVGELLESGDWHHLSLPAIAPVTRQFQLLNGRTHLWQAGTPLHPAREDHAELDALKRAMGLENFRAQYLQEPLPETGNLLKRAWPRRYKSLPVRQPGDQVVQSWDTALKAGPKNDYSVCLTFLVRNRNQYHLMDVYRERVEFHELLKGVRAQANNHRPHAILIEDAGSGTSLASLAKAGGMQGVIPCKVHGDKLTRMRNQTPQLEAHSLILPDDAPWLEDFWDEFLKFPQARHDDQIDALSQFLEWVGKPKGIFEVDWGIDRDGNAGPTIEAMFQRFGRG